MIRALLFFLALSFCGVTTATAQVLVYKIEFQPEKGVNYHSFQGGYFVAPLLGGKGSFILTNTESEPVYLTSQESGRLFTATNAREKKAVIAANTGSAIGAFLVMGEINHSINASGPSYNLSAQVAKTLQGSLIIADDESTVEVPAEDGSVGVAGFSRVSLTLDEGQTLSANQSHLTVVQSTERLRQKLENEGYLNLYGEAQTSSVNAVQE